MLTTFFLSLKETSRWIHYLGVFATITLVQVLLRYHVNHLELEYNVFTTRLWIHIWECKHSMIFVSTQVEYRKHKRTLNDYIDESLIRLMSGLKFFLTIYSPHSNLYIFIFAIRHRVIMLNSTIYWKFYWDSNTSFGI